MNNRPPISSVRANLTARLVEVRRERDQFRAGYFSQLHMNPVNGWLDEGQLDSIYHAKKNLQTKPGTFLRVYTQQMITESEFSEAFFADAIRLSATGKPFYHPRFKREISPPFYFGLMPHNNHFVLVEVDASGNAIIHNELGTSYDEETIKILLKFGFTREKIRFPEHKNKGKYNQPDAHSCGDRFIRTLFEKVGINHPITEAQTSRELRKHIHTLLQESLEATASWRDYAANIQSIEQRLRSLVDEEVQLPAKPTNPEPTKSEPSKQKIPNQKAEESFISVNNAKKQPFKHHNDSFLKRLTPIIEQLENDGWKARQNLEDKKVKSVTLSKNANGVELEFEIQPHIIVTTSKEVETFEAMLQAFMKAHPGEDPLITVRHADNLAKWQTAYCKVYTTDKVPEHVIEFKSVVQTEPKKSPAPEAGVNMNSMKKP